MINGLMNKFKELYGVLGEKCLYFAPGRVNLIGEHTDYNGGHVFPCALTLGTYAIVQKRTDDKLLMYSMNFPEEGVVCTSLNELEADGSNSWANYMKGVFWTFQKRGYDLKFGLNVAIYGDIPAGSGLSSSASLEVLTALIIKETYRIKDVDQKELALIGQYSENHYNGMNCGIMDQFASAMGKRKSAIFLDTSTLEYEYAPIELNDARIVITNSKVKHSLVGSAYNDRRRECETALKELQTALDIRSLGDLTEEEFEESKHLIADEVCRKRAKHAVYENQRTIRAVSALKSGNIEEFGKLMNDSHVSLRDDYEVSCEEVDTLVDLAWSLPGVIGSRITGGGFGGCTVSIIKENAVEDYIKAAKKGYQEKVGMEPEFYIVDAGEGAHFLRREVIFC